MITCPTADSLISHGHFITGNSGCQVVSFLNLTTCPGVSKVSNTFRKKGCDDSYGNGQGRYVR